MLFSNVVFLLLLNDILLLAAPGISWLIRLTCAQGILLSALLLDVAHIPLGLAVLGIKGALLPYLLARTYKKIGIREKTRRLNRAIAVFMGMLGLVFALWLENRLTIMPDIFPNMLMPTAITTLLCGLILVVGRATTLSQAIGYLVAENGIFLLGLPLMAAGAIWFELALLLDIFVAVFVMGIAIGHIGEKFDSLDTAHFRNLRD